MVGFLTRADHTTAVPGVETRQDWDALGMRASQSCTTVLDGSLLRERDVLTTTPVGPNPDPVVWGIFGCFELLLAAVELPGALEQGSALREPINRALLRLQETGRYEALRQEWFGENR